MEQTKLKTQFNDDQINYDYYLQRLESLQARISYLIDELKNPVTYILSPSFEGLYQQAKQQDIIDQLWQEKYRTIIAYNIEGQINTTLACLGQIFKSQFGGSIVFWMEIVCKFAQNQKYDQTLKIWQVVDLFKQYLPIQKGQYEKIRKFRKLAKNDIQATRNLILSLNQLKQHLQNQKNGGSKKFPDDVYEKVKICIIKHKQLHRKLCDLLIKQQQNPNDLQFFQAKKPVYKQQLKIQQNRQVSNSRRKNNSKQPINTNMLKQKTITQFSTQIMENKGIQFLRKIQGQQKQFNAMLPQKIKQLDSLFQNLSNNSTNLQSLRQKTIQSKSTLLSKQKPLYVCIRIFYSSYYYHQYLISEQKYVKFNLANPFQEQQFINYQNNDIEQYEQLLGDNLSDSQDLDSEDDETYQSSLDTEERRQFLDSGEVYNIDEQDFIVNQRAISLNKAFQGNPWILNHKEPHLISIFNSKTSQQQLQQKIQTFFNQTQVICFSDEMMKTQALRQNQLDQTSEQKLKQIVRGRTYGEIISIIDGNQNLKQEFTRVKIKKFLKDKARTKKVKGCNGARDIHVYIILDEIQEKQSKQKSKRSSLRLKQSQLDSYSYSKSLISKKNQQFETEYQDESNNLANSKFLEVENNCFKNQTIQQKLQPTNTQNHQFSSNNSQQTTQHGDQRTRKSENSRIFSQSDNSGTRTMTLRQKKKQVVYDQNKIFGLCSSKKKSVKNQRELEI